jgi:2-amino-4-hydroxy-6-hydroxymethyldihydropteridine diphosphokinase
MAIYLGLGANLGDRRANLTRALQMLPPAVRVDAVSALYESPPQPPAPPPAYLNAACRVTTELSAQELIALTQAIQSALGRTDTTHWAPRPIDIDILLYDDLRIDESELTVPHPRIVQRAFVLQPLLDLDPALVHPVTGLTIEAHLRALGAYELTQVAGPGWHTFQRYDYVAT